MELHDSISSIKGIGPKKAEALSKLNIKTLEDLIYFFPRDYEDRRCVKNISQLEEDETAVIRARVTLWLMTDTERAGNSCSGCW